MVNPESGLPGAVSNIAFATRLDGWLYGPGLWATHDGGRSWHEAHVNEQVLQLVTGDGYVWLITGACTSDEVCQSFTLRRSPEHLDRFSALHPGPFEPFGPAPSLAVEGTTVAVMADIHPASMHYRHQTIDTSTNAGTSWTSRPGPCDSDLGGQLTITRTADWASCPTGMMGFVAVAPPNGTFRIPAGPFSIPNSVIVASNAGTTVVGAYGPALHRTTDRGQHWSDASLPARLGGGNWTQFAFTDSPVSFALYTRPLSAVLLASGDDMRSWHVINPL